MNNNIQEQAEKLKNTILKIIYDNLPAQVGLTEGIEVAKRILAAIQKVSVISEDQLKQKFVNALHNSIKFLDAIDECVEITKEYALQYQSVPVSEWISMKDRVPDEGKLVELATEHGKNGYARSLEIHKVENMYQEKKTLYYRGCVSKCTWDIFEWSHWRYHNENDLPFITKKPL